MGDRELTLASMALWSSLITLIQYEKEAFWAWDRSIPYCFRRNRYPGFRFLNSSHRLMDGSEKSRHVDSIKSGFVELITLV